MHNIICGQSGSCNTCEFGTFPSATASRMSASSVRAKNSRPPRNVSKHVHGLQRFYVLLELRLSRQHAGLLKLR